MFLKTLELIGFKSFPERTALHFQPGMTAIVGPNGCGKSNVSDAIRWVLGEQSAKALRGSKMEDCIFNGTDNRKQMGMAEVSITFADCDSIIETDYNEITITRRVFRSGEGQYFINKAPCRLKDVQRLFMDTGIGTTSYSVLEQGRVDRILSSRPEDRRAVFEEASGIMKYKADKKEALRKLEHTEANLVRLADVIREVKRQIGSLQRQAGKARRYKAMREELRNLEIYLTKKRAEKYDFEMQQIKSQLAELEQNRTAIQTDISSLEERTGAVRQKVANTEHEIAERHEKEVEARSSLDHTKELIEMNRKRIGEYTSLSERDNREAERAGSQIESHRQALEDLREKIETAVSEKDSAEQSLTSAKNNLEEHNSRMNSLQQLLKDLQAESIELESRHSSVQNRIAELESRQQTEAAQKERLFAEQAQLQRSLDSYHARMQKTEEQLKQAEAASSAKDSEVATLKEKLSAANSRAAATSETLSSLKEEMTSARARKSMLEESLQAPLASAGNPQIDSAAVSGTLVSRIDVDPGYELCLQAVLSCWLDALLVSDYAAASELAAKLKSEDAAPARLLSVHLDAARPADAALDYDALLDHIRSDEELRPLVGRLLQNVYVVDSLENVPASLPASTAFVTRHGLVSESSGRLTVFAESSETASIRKKRELEQTVREMERLESESASVQQKLAEESAESKSIESQLEERREESSHLRHELAVRQGEFQVVRSETEQAGERLSTVTWELNSLAETDSEENSTDREKLHGQLAEMKSRREELSSSISERTAELHQMQNTQAELQSALTERSIASAGVSQQLDMLRNQESSNNKRIEELTELKQERTANARSYNDSIENLRKSVAEAEGKLDEYRKAAEENAERAEALRRDLEKHNGELNSLEDQTAKKRRLAEELRETKSDLDLKYNQCSMKKQSGFERICNDYNISRETVMEEADPEWNGEPPSEEAADTKTTELRTKLEGMGPVNLVAIEEYEELKERHAFLTKQESDLTAAKEQLLKVIREINKTTSEMFRSTFDSVNSNFQKMFKQLFNGGSAKLVLVNEEDVLECGIEIIARPPGKRLQNISLLSGGEKTLTAVALLFAIYMIKPSPFCLLDELDAALDESNIGRFVGILKGFLSQSQFVVITHNRKTIAAADTIYGVTMPEKGVSRIVSMRFKDHEGATVPKEEPVGTNR